MLCVIASLLVGGLRELILLDAPVTLGAARVLRTGRYAPLHTAAADADRADVDARVALVRQPPRRPRGGGGGGGGCPDYAARGVRGALVLEAGIHTADCSLRTRVALAAAAGALGWLHVPSRPAGAIGEPGFDAYAALEAGDAALLATAPPAVEVGQGGGAGLAWLVDALEAGAEPRARLRLRRGERDAWAAARGSGWFTLWQAVVALSTLAVLELSLCRLYTLVAYPAVTPVYDVRVSRLSRGTNEAAASAWQIGPVVLCTCATSAMLRLVYVLGDPVWAYGHFSFLLGLALLVTPAVLGLVTQLVHVVYTFEIVDAVGGLETLMLSHPRLKAIVVLGGAALLGVEIAVLAPRDAVQGGTALLALALVGCPAALALAYWGLVLKVRRLMSGAGRAGFERKLRRSAVGNAVIAAAALPLYWLHAAPVPMMVLSCAILVAQGWLEYMLAEQIAPIGTRALRGPLRVLVELARHGARSVRAQQQRSTSRSLRQIAPTSRGESAAASERRAAKTTTPVKPARYALGAESIADVDEAQALGGMPAPVLASEDVASTHLALGVSLACLRDFVLEQRVASTSSTADVVARIRELTASSRRSFAEELAHANASDGQPAVGRATVFVSHAQACNFVKLLAALHAYVDVYKVADDTYFWLDLMCIRQHEVAADVMRIGDVIVAIGKVAMVLDPWHRPVCLERVWCLYEIAQTVGTTADAARGEREPRRNRTSSVSMSSSRPPADEPRGLLMRSASEGDLLAAIAEAAAAAGPPSEPDASSSFASTNPSGRRKTRTERVRSLVMPAESVADEAVEAPRRRKPRMASLSVLVKPFHADAAAPPARAPRVQLFLTMSPRERLKLVHAVRTSQSQIMRALTRFDCRTAGAFVDADRRMILNYIAAKFAPANAPVHQRQLSRVLPTPSELAPAAPSASAAAAQRETPETAAYDNFNARVKVAIREAFASFSHLPTEHMAWGSPTLRNGATRGVGFIAEAGDAAATQPTGARALEEETTATAAVLTEDEKRDVERMLGESQASASLLRFGGATVPLSE